MDVLDLIGNTPLLSLKRLSHDLVLGNQLFAKWEGANPGGSSKDRIAKSLFLKAERAGKITPDTQIIEATSGNTGIALAQICAYKDIALRIYIPDNCSALKRAIMTSLGAEVIVTPGHLGMAEALRRVANDLETNADALNLNQFGDLDNSLTHYQTTGPEIWRALPGQVDIVIAGIGTGGTISGVGRYLKEQNPNIEIIGVEPSESPFLTKGIKGAHQIEGIGAGFCPATYQARYVDRIIRVSSKQARSMQQLLAKKEGIVAGPSSGAVLAAAVEIALLKVNKNIVVILPDRGERYLI